MWQNLIGMSLTLCSLSVPSSAANLNLQLIFDASGSMAGRIEGEPKISAAKQAASDLITALPDQGLNVGFRVYGHKGDNTEARRNESCQATELIVPMQAVDKDALSSALSRYRPTGWTPISRSLTAAANDFAPNPDGRNVVVIITDGEETCLGDPCATAKALAASNIELVAHVIGFGLQPEQAQTLRCIADNSGGLYFSADDRPSLTNLLLGLVDAEVRTQGQQLDYSGLQVQLPGIELKLGESQPNQAPPRLQDELDQGININLPGIRFNLPTSPDN